MHPVLFQLGNIPVFSYGVLVATGVLLSLWYGRRIAPEAGVDPEKMGTPNREGPFPFKTSKCANSLPPR